MAIKVEEIEDQLEHEAAALAGEMKHLKAELA